MNHKLRPRRSPQFVPVAAEVLELRTLLSAAGIAAHAAAHHAAVETHAGQTQSVGPHAVHVSQNAEITFGSGTPQLVPVKFSISSFHAVDGAKVTAHASASVTISGIKTTFKATFTGTVQSIVPGTGYNTFFLTPTGGSIVYTLNGGGQHFKATALPNGTQSKVVIFGDQFVSFQATDQFKPDSPSGFANQTIVFDLSTT